MEKQQAEVTLAGLWGYVGGHVEIVVSPSYRYSAELVGVEILSQKEVLITVGEVKMQEDKEAPWRQVANPEAHLAKYFRLIAGAFSSYGPATQEGVFFYNSLLLGVMYLFYPQN